MSTTSRAPDGHRKKPVPTRDGRPIAETELHLTVLCELIALLTFWYADDPFTKVSGNLLLYYVPGDNRRRTCPDVFVTRGIPKQPMRDYYLVWEEGRAPDLVIEVTSKSTRKEDLETKYALYRDVLGVTEYFLFDPKGEYLRPQLQGYRLAGCKYIPIEPVNGRLASEVTGLHLEASGQRLRLWDPQQETWLLTADERCQRDSLARQQAEEQFQRDSVARRQAEEDVLRAQAEIERHKGMPPPTT